MASVFKRKYTKVVDGKRVKKQSKSWYVKYRDSEGIERRVRGYKDKIATQQLAAKLEKEAELGNAGVVDRYKEHRLRHLAEHLEDFSQSLVAKGDTTKQVKQVTSRVKRIIETCKFITWPDTQASKVLKCLSDLRYKGEKISSQTYNFYLKAMKQFCKWMVLDGRAAESPLEHLKCKTVRKIIDEVHPRRVLQIDELKRLLEVTKSAPKRFGMTGHERYLLYRLAAETGLRAKELRSLKVSSFDLDNLTVCVSQAYTKNKQEAVQSLRLSTAAELREFFVGKLPNVKAFGGTYKQLTDKTSKMIEADLADAGIAYVVDGLYFDFHALRHQTGTLLAASGVHPKVAQKIMRHSDINLTLSRYTHTLTGQEADAIASLPDLGSLQGNRNVATGTDGKAVDMLKNDSKKSTPKLTPKLTPTAFSACNQLAADVSSLSPKAEKVRVRKHLPSRKLGSKREGMSSRVTDEKKIRLEGFGPPTFGSVDRRTENTSAEKTSTSETPETQLTPQLTPNSRKQGEVDTSELPPDLTLVVRAWPELPESIRSAIVAIVRASKE